MAWGTADGRLAASVANPADEFITEQLADAAANVETLGLTSVSLTPVPDSAGVDNVRLTWHAPGVDQAAVLTLGIKWRTSGKGASIAGVVSAETTLPLWVLERLDARSASRVVVAGGEGTDLQRILDDATQALGRVDETFPAWQGDLFVEAPSTTSLLAESLATNAAYDDVAAVTTSIDGSVGDLVGQRVLLHPEIYPAMDVAAARLVMTHEVVHVAMQSSSRPLPLWWSEGLADYVAFSTVPASDGRFARQLLKLAEQKLAADVGEHGLPPELPAPSAFSGERQDAAYEASRRACAVLVRLASRSSDPATASPTQLLQDFNEQLATGRKVQDALPAIFGLTYPQFLRAWQRSLGETTRSS